MAFSSAAMSAGCCDVPTDEPGVMLRKRNGRMRIGAI
jgi:hypothetical protein